MNAVEKRELTWPVADVGTALEYLALSRGLLQDTTEIPKPPALPAENPAERVRALGQWMDVVALRLGIEVESFHLSYGEVESMLRQAGPALLWLGGEKEPVFLALVKGHTRTCTLLGSDLHTHTVPTAELRDWLCEPVEAPLLPGIQKMMARAGMEDKHKQRIQKALLRERLDSKHILGGWLLRLPPGASFWQQLREAHVPRYAGMLLGAHVLQYILLLLAWWMIGRGALQGSIDAGWLMAWLLLLVSTVPLRLLVTWSQGRIAIHAGAALKRRLLHGALRLAPEEIRNQGSGQLLGQVLESQAVESLALSGGFLAFVAVFELILAGTVLGLGAAGLLHVLLYLGWIGVCVAAGWFSFVRQRQWTRGRLDLTNDLVERMVGHRTRLAQQQKEQWHDGEDQELQRYLDASSRMDQASTALMAVLSRGWLVIGLAGLLPAFVSGRASLGLIAVGLGGVLLASQALARLGGGLTQISSAVIAWEQIAPLFQAASRPTPPGDPAFAVPASHGNKTHTDDSTESTDEFADTTEASSPSTVSAETSVLPYVLEAYELTFRYRERGQPVIQGCSLRIVPGDRLLLQGPSGGGKSTFASLLAGLREAESGLLLLQGLDRHTLGEQGWRQRVVTAPQFHENHVLTGTFAFNLLMGRDWPPSPQDMQEAYKICHELGLGPLLERMPGGLLQMVGESGWQLSHGEKSRLYIARALLQHSDLILLDESFAALDPENLSIALQCVLRRAPTLFVIAHP